MGSFVSCRAASAFPTVRCFCLVAAGSTSGGSLCAWGGPWISSGTSFFKNFQTVSFPGKYLTLTFLALVWWIEVLDMMASWRVDFHVLLLSRHLFWNWWLELGLGHFTFFFLWARWVRLFYWSSISISKIWRGMREVCLADQNQGNLDLLFFPQRRWRLCLVFYHKSSEKELEEKGVGYHPLCMWEDCYSHLQIGQYSFQFIFWHRFF